MKIEAKSKIRLACDKLPFTCSVVYIKLISNNYVKLVLTYKNSQVNYKIQQFSNSNNN